VELGLSTSGAGLLGMAPPFAFAVFGALTPAIVRRLGLERTAWIGMALAGAGQLLRGFAPEAVSFLAFSLFALGGMGIGNVVLPPLVKRYFPDRVGPVTSAYVVLLALSTAVPPLLAVPVADEAGWRVSVGQWSLLAAVAVVPWVVASRRPEARRPPELGALTAHIPIHVVLRSPLAWGLAALIGVTSLNTYAMFAWLPELLVDAGLDDGQAGALLGLYAAVGMPVAVLVPWLAARMRNPLPIVLVTLLFYVGGYAGLALAPAWSPVLWVVLAGLAPAAFPLSLALVNLRSRTTQGSAALSGFAQGVGYTLAGLGPLVVAVLHESSGGWRLPLLFLAGTLAVQVTGAVVVCRPRMVEDDLSLPQSADPLPEPIC
jgi:CP family cyanate transporter-like MFS transporter